MLLKLLTDESHCDFSVKSLPIAYNSLKNNIAQTTKTWLMHVVYYSGLAD